MNSNRPKGTCKNPRSGKPSSEPSGRRGEKPSSADNLLRRGMLVELLVETLDSEGVGVARHMGRIVKVGGTLPQDRCMARISYMGKISVTATLERIIRPSPLRIQPSPCGDAQQCLGCPLIEMSYQEQLQWKHQLVRNEFEKFTSLNNVRILEPLSPGPTLHYRTSAKLAVGGFHYEPYIGIYRRASHDLVDLEDCPLHHPAINMVVKAAREGIRKLKVPIWQEKNRTGILRYIAARVSASTGEIMVTFVTARRAFNEIHHLGRFIQECIPQITVLCQNVNQSEGNLIFGPNDHFITKQHSIRDRVGSVELLVSPRSFTQVHNQGAALLYGKVLEWAGLDGSQKVLDLYCGIGGISLTIAPHARQVQGVEISGEAVADARINSKLNGARNCRFEAGGSLDILSDLAEDGERFDLVVLNPPRKGCDRGLPEILAGMAPRRIIYVSCSPATLARDLDILFRLGYTCPVVQPVDMFPHTPHIENVALLERSA